MKFKQVDDNDPSAEFEIEDRACLPFASSELAELGDWRSCVLRRIRIVKEKSNAEMAIDYVATVYPSDAKVMHPEQIRDPEIERHYLAGYEAGRNSLQEKIFLLRDHLSQSSMSCDFHRKGHELFWQAFKELNINVVLQNNRDLRIEDIITALKSYKNSDADEAAKLKWVSVDEGLPDNENLYEK